MWQPLHVTAIFLTHMWAIKVDINTSFLALWRNFWQTEGIHLRFDLMAIVSSIRPAQPPHAHFGENVPCRSYFNVLGDRLRGIVA